MTTALYTYHPSPFGTVLERLDCAADPVVEGRRLAAVMRSKPEGQRAVLCNDLGGGRSKDEYHLWTAKDADGKPRPLTVEEARQVYVNDARDGAFARVRAWMRSCAYAYADAGSPTIDFLACNVETMPGAFLWTEARFSDVVGWAGAYADIQDQKDYMQQRGAVVGGGHINVLLNPFFAHTVANLGACNFHGPQRDKNGQLFGDSAPCGVSAPFLYLTETHRGAGTPTPASVLAHNLGVWEDVQSPKVAVIAPPSWGGEGDKASVPGCTGVTFRSTAGWSRKFWRKDWQVWLPYWTRLVEFVAQDAVAIVLWSNDGKIFGPAPSATEVAAMSQVFSRLG